MSERIHDRSEQHHPSHGAEVQPRHQEKHTEHAPKTNEAFSIEEIQKRVEQHAKSHKETTLHQPEHHHESSPTFHRELKQQALKRTLKRIQGHLSPGERILSKVVHQPKIDVLSSAAARTIARPQALLSGSFIAFFGSLALLILAKRYGFTYNFFVLIPLFAAGFGLGIVLELLAKLLRRKSRA